MSNGTSNSQRSLFGSGSSRYYLRDSAKEKPRSSTYRSPGFILSQTRIGKQNLPADRQKWTVDHLNYVIDRSARVPESKLGPCDANVSRHDQQCAVSDDELLAEIFAREVTIDEMKADYFSSNAATSSPRSDREKIIQQTMQAEKAKYRDFKDTYPVRPLPSSMLKAAHPNMFVTDGDVPRSNSGHVQALEGRSPPVIDTEPVNSPETAYQHHYSPLVAPLQYPFEPIAEPRSSSPPLPVSTDFVDAATGEKFRPRGLQYLREASADETIAVVAATSSPSTTPLKSADKVVTQQSNSGEKAKVTRNTFMEGCRKAAKSCRTQLESLSKAIKEVQNCVDPDIRNSYLQRRAEFSRVLDADEQALHDVGMVTTAQLRNMFGRLDDMIEEIKDLIQEIKKLVQENAEHPAKLSPVRRESGQPAPINMNRFKWSREQSVGVGILPSGLPAGISRSASQEVATPTPVTFSLRKDSVDGVSRSSSQHDNDLSVHEIADILKDQKRSYCEENKEVLRQAKACIMLVLNNTSIQEKYVRDNFQKLVDVLQSKKYSNKVALLDMVSDAALRNVVEAHQRQMYSLAYILRSLEANPEYSALGPLLLSNIYSKATVLDPACGEGDMNSDVSANPKVKNICVFFTILCVCYNKKGKTVFSQLLLDFVHKLPTSAWSPILADTVSAVFSTGGYWLKKEKSVSSVAAQLLRDTIPSLPQSLDSGGDIRRMEIELELFVKKGTHCYMPEYFQTFTF